MGAVSRRDEAPTPVPVDPATLPALEVDELAKESEDLLVARAVAYGREYKRIENHPTMLLKNLASVAVALRVQYDDIDGKKHAYRQVMADIYRKAGMDDRAQTAARYHIGNLVRRTFTAREIERAGLLPTSPLERLQDTRKGASKLVSAAKVITSVDPTLLDNLAQPPQPAPATSKKPAKPKKGTSSADEQTKSSGPELKATADTLRLAQVAGGIIGQFKPDVITDHMTDGQRAKLDEELEAIQKRITALRRHTRKPRSKA
ncbi:hypothetical protein ACFQ8W_00400 [Streptomyces sp. NPDC056508]|uniref:hypothetical protein n=1 Tax=Streptomyces sp. NPDC056508 TaxID=3345845 RepID=UPI0036CC2E74